MDYSLVNKHEAAQAAGMSPATLKEYRLGDRPALIEGVHYERFNSRVIRYRLGLVKHWSEHRHRPQEHLRVVEHFLQTQG